MGCAIPNPTFGRTSSENTAKPAVNMQVAATPAQINAVRDLENVFSDVAGEASSAVVSIQAGGGRGGQGSGFIVRPNGWVVTNAHVVGNAQEVTVVTNDGREYRGKVYNANDEFIDLAVIKIEANNLPVLNLANSETVRPGQFAIALGSPFGLENSITVGHISAVHRNSGAAMDPNFGGMRAYFGMIQTDASINPGNSGGPLVNLDGEVIGVNSTILSASMSSAGIGFSIPANVVKPVIDELINTGKFDRGALGVEINDLRPYQLKERNLQGGAIVGQTPQDSAGYRGGLRQGDVITQINGKPIRNQIDLRVALFSLSPGQGVDLSYLREGQSRNGRVTLQEAPVANRMPQRQDPRIPRGWNNAPNPFSDDFMTPEAPSAPRREAQPDQNQQPVRLGVGLRSIDATARETFALPSDATGLVVTTVAPGSFADASGVRPGDVLVRVNQTNIRSAEDVSSALRQIRRGEMLRVDVRRYENGSVQSLTIVQPAQ